MLSLREGGRRGSRGQGHYTELFYRVQVFTLQGLWCFSAEMSIIIITMINRLILMMIQMIIYFLDELLSSRQVQLMSIHPDILDIRTNGATGWGGRRLR